MNIINSILNDLMTNKNYNKFDNDDKEKKKEKKEKKRRKRRKRRKKKKREEREEREERKKREEEERQERKKNEKLKRIRNKKIYKKKKIIEIHGDSDLPKKGWIQGCYACDIPTSLTNQYIDPVVKNRYFDFYIYVCKDCKKKRIF